MNKVQLTKIYLITSFVLLFIGMAYGTSQVLAYFNTGAPKEELLMLSSSVANDYYQPKVTLEPLNNKGRKVTSEFLGKLTKNYVAAHFHLHQAIRTNRTEGLDDFYTEQAKEHLIQLIENRSIDSLEVNGTSISHHMRLDFYAQDGTVATLTDEVISFRQVSTNNFHINQYDTSTYKVMLLLEDNNWRVRHRVKVDDSLLTENNSEMLPAANSKPSIGDFKIKGINYYPQHYPWQEMWTHFDSIDLQTDFDRIHQLGFNTIRIFVPFGEFGGAQIKNPKLVMLKSLMDQAHASKLKVIVTLFDFFLGYPISEWTLSDRHAEIIIQELKDHPALLAWDIKNEPDLDFDTWGKNEVLAWLDFMARRIRSYDSSTALTIGWSNPEYIDLLEKQVDFCSFHYYRDPEELPALLETKDTNKPLFLGEIGSHSFDKWWYPFSRSINEQNNYFEKIGEVIREKDLHYAVWTMYDFKEIPSNVAGRWPWQKGPQKKYGIIDNNGNLKPAYQWIKALNEDTNEK